MKKRYALPFLAFALATSAGAQTLTDGTSSLQAAESYIMHYAPYQAPGNAGASQSWNFSTLTTDSTEVMSFTVPGSTAYYASFVGSTVAQDAGGGDYVYFKGDASGFELMGVATGGDLIIYQNTERIMNYPCSYLTQWIDAFNADFTISGVDISRSGTVAGNADGYGSVIMPFGTVSNVLRVKNTEIYSDVTPFGNIDYNFVTYNFFRPGVHAPIVTISTQTTTVLGTPSTSQYAVWLDATQVGIQEALRNSIGVEVYPNPATSDLSVVFSADGGHGLTVELLDLTGKVIQQRYLGQRSAGIQKEVFDISSLDAGLYNVRITDGQGGQGVKRVVVE